MVIILKTQKKKQEIQRKSKAKRMKFQMIPMKTMKSKQKKEKKKNLRNQRKIQIKSNQLIQMMTTTPKKQKNPNQAKKF